MSSDLIGSFSALELLWTATAVVGVVFSLQNAREALADFMALGGKINGRRRLSLGDIRREAVRLLIYAVSIVAGIIAGLQPARPGGPSTAGLVITLILVLIALLQLSQSVLDRLDRRYLMSHGLQARDENGRFTKE